MSPRPAPLSSAVLPAFLSALGLALFAWIDRLPAAADYVVPRHPGWGLFSLGLAAVQGPGGRALSAAAFLLLAGALFLLGRGFWKALGTAEERRGLWSARGLLAAAAGVAEAVRLRTNVTIVPLCVSSKEMGRRGGLASELRDKETIWARRTG